MLSVLSVVWYLYAKPLDLSQPTLIVPNLSQEECESIKKQIPVCGTGCIIAPGGYFSAVCTSTTAPDK